VNIQIQHCLELKVNQLVVHIEHGIGLYKGLTTLTTPNGITTEYLIIVYANKAKLYVPISYLHLISQYQSYTNTNIPLDKLGNSNWKKEKHKVFKKIHDYAAKLLDTYSLRISKKGFSFSIQYTKYKKFIKKFPFTTTPDQEKVINTVLKDMHKSTPMDRLVCGDVGFGKTEVAMRAAFIAVCNSKQVAILVPTTLLAQQHFNNFSQRFKNWNVKIGILSRFSSDKLIKSNIQQVSQGTIHILIGTHKMLFSSIKWKDLGLLIIDEEHRFGVLDKEKIKENYINIDILTLTATPIPRTLNMTINGIRDLSIIATPPEKRRSIKTIIENYDENIIKKAIKKEIERKGQVYFIHNNIMTIQKKANLLKKLIPESKIAVAHGGMKSSYLKEIIKKFYLKNFNILVCTTLIETGIDIPNVNTIIVERADQFGLSQLHQLRGRIGRSHHQAYAWLLVQNFKKTTLNAQKRLEAISKFEDLGAGFILSSHDLEIRGIGNLLGNEQSGHINSIGFSLYMKLLNQAIKNLKSGNSTSLEKMLSFQPEIELYIISLIPSQYISNVNKRLFFYKKIFSAENKLELKNIKKELNLKFGTIPNEVNNLIKISYLRIIFKKIGIKRAILNKNTGKVCFDKKTPISHHILIQNLSDYPILSWSFSSEKCIQIHYKLCNENIRLEWILSFAIKIAMMVTKK